jgi:hypothetical protein
MKVHLISARTGAEEESISQRNRLMNLWSISSRRHEITDSAEIADIILVSDLAGPNWFVDLRCNRSVNLYPEKSFAISDSDYAFPLLHGIYTSATNRLPFITRFRSAGYNLYPDEYLNPHLIDHSGDAYKNEKKYLYSFVGRDSSPVRNDLFKLTPQKDILICNSTNSFAAFGPSPEPKENWQKKYVQILNDSKYSLCPRGVGAASLRLFESLKMGVAPVILSDNWMLPEGPEWSQFLIQVPECKASSISEILKYHESEYAQRGMLARKAFESYFSNDVYFDYLIDLCTRISDSQQIPERLFWSLRNALVSVWKKNKKLFVP